MKEWTAKDIPSQSGRLAIVTGALTGIGYDTALQLAIAGGAVIVAGRNEERGKEVIARIKSAAKNTEARFEHIDLSDLASVNEFSERLLQAGRPVDLLINNAGVMAPPQRRTTKDGFELQLGTNHLGHFALTGRLLPLLSRKGTRVVNVSSLAHRMGRIAFDDLQAEKGYTPFKSYSQSKLANILFTLELQRLSDLNGWGLMSTASHPGYSRTELIAKGPGKDSMMATVSGALIMPFFSHDSAHGALPTLRAATDLAVEPFGYYGPSGFLEMKGSPAPAIIARQGLDVKAARRLWEASEKLTGVKFAENLQLV